MPRYIVKDKEGFVCHQEKYTLTPEKYWAPGRTIYNWKTGEEVVSPSTAFLSDVLTHRGWKEPLGEAWTETSLVARGICWDDYRPTECSTIKVTREGGEVYLKRVSVSRCLPSRNPRIDHTSYSVAPLFRSLGPTDRSKFRDVTSRFQHSAELGLWSRCMLAYHYVKSKRPFAVLKEDYEKTGRVPEAVCPFNNTAYPVHQEISAPIRLKYFSVSYLSMKNIPDCLPTITFSLEDSQRRRAGMEVQSYWDREILTYREDTYRLSHGIRYISEVYSGYIPPETENTVYGETHVIPNNPVIREEDGVIHLYAGPPFCPFCERLMSGGTDPMSLLVCTTPIRVTNESCADILEGLTHGDLVVCHPPEPNEPEVVLYLKESSPDYLGGKVLLLSETI